jgi:hypothetical protein
MKPQGNKKKRLGWKIGLGIGFLCLVVIIIAVSYFISENLSRGKKEIVASFEKAVDQYVAEGKLPREQIDIIKELAQIVKYKEASTWAILLSSGIVQNAMEDGQISDQEYQDIKSIRDLLRKTNGNLSFAECGKFLNDNPRIKEIFESLRKKHRR